MKALGLENRTVQDIIGNLDNKLVVLDIETLDTSVLKIWNAPIISFSLSAIKNIAIEDLSVDSFAIGIDNLEEEQKLLSIIRKSLLAVGNCTVTGHNISYNFSNISQGMNWKQGYDLPKIQKRGIEYGIDFSFLSRLKVFDTMDIAYKHYNHEEHNRIFGAEKQKILKCEYLESDFGIKRPTDMPKLGLKARDMYLEYLSTHNKNLLETILKYNCCDTLVESMITKIFLHSLNKCVRDDGLISFKEKCVHIPSSILVEENATWKKLSQMQITKY